MIIQTDLPVNVVKDWTQLGTLFRDDDIVVITAESQLIVVLALGTETGVLGVCLC